MQCGAALSNAVRRQGAFYARGLPPISARGQIFHRTNGIVTILLVREQIPCTESSFWRGRLDKIVNKNAESVATDCVYV